MESVDGGADTPGSTGEPDQVTVAEGEAPAAHLDPQPGDRVGRYVVRRRLGSGGMGVVLAAHDPELDREVALKVLGHLDWESDGRTRTLREAQALARLTHPNVVPVYDVGDDGTSVFIAMEIVRGATLGEWLARERAAGRGPSWREILARLIEAGRGLAEAHAAGLVHRDFKPSNVMLDERDGRAMVLDFGLAGLARDTDTDGGSTDASFSDLPAAGLTGFRLGAARRRPRRRPHRGRDGPRHAGIHGPRAALRAGRHPQVGSVRVLHHLVRSALPGPSLRGIRPSPRSLGPRAPVGSVHRPAASSRAGYGGWWPAVCSPIPTAGGPT